MHGDLKPDNIFLSRIHNVWVVSDLGSVYKIKFDKEKKTDN